MTRLTQPGKTDLHFMTVTCTPSDTAVEFCETHAEAVGAAKVNLGAPGASVYVGTVSMQGEHRTRSSASQVAIVVPVDAELRAILRARYGAVTRADLVAAITRLVACTMATLRSEGAIPPSLGETYTQVSPDPAAHPGQSSGDEHTQPGETMSCGCAVGTHEPRLNRIGPATDALVRGGICALGWPLSWRTP